MTSWWDRRVYDAAYWSGCFLYSLGWSMRIHGRTHAPQNGPLIIIANHQSYLDPWLIGLAVPRYLTYVARTTLFQNRFLGRLIRALGAFPINREGLGKDGLALGLQILAQGGALCIFPEGERTYDGRMSSLEPGTALLVRRSKAPVISVGIAGAYAAWPRQRRLPIPAPIWLPATDRTLALAVGRVIPFHRLADLSRDQLMALLFEDLQKTQAKAESIRRKPSPL